MRRIEELRALLVRLDGRPYPAYKDIRGAWNADAFTLLIDYVQGDPFAEPSRVRARVPAGTAGLPAYAWTSETARVATADFLLRSLRRALSRRSQDRGSGRSGELRILAPGQEVLPRTALRVHEDGSIEARFRAGLPARGRRILGREAARLLGHEIVDAVLESLRHDTLDADALRLHVRTVEDARALRAQLASRGLVAFIADDAALPRASGVDDRPLRDFVPFRSPDTLRVTLETPHSGAIAGMGVPRGITLITGGGFHGKSTLLRALERGVYDHVPGDGRERVVCIESAVKVRAEDGRAVAGADISNFIGPLPRGGDTRAFTTSNASGSTSQAAAIVEALEAGARCLLLDEDTSATNFMIRDARMQALVHGTAEPITPFIDRARQLLDEQGVSTILVVGGSGDYFDIADTVIAMKAYRPADVTERARAIAAERPTHRQREGGEWRPLSRRVPLPDSLDTRRGRKPVHIRAFSEERVTFGSEELDLRAVEQLVETAQARAIALAISAERGRSIDGRKDIREALEGVMARIARDGLDAVQEEPAGEIAGFRVFELAAVIGRIRSLRMRSGQQGEG